MKLQSLPRKLIDAYLEAPATKTIPATIVANTLLCGFIGAGIGLSFFWSAYAGLLSTTIVFWLLFRRARICRERAAANVTTSVLARIAAK